MGLKRIGIDIVNNLGFDIYKKPGKIYTNKLKLFKHLNIDCVLDVGANTGQYASKLIKYGYKGTVLSFEPQQKTFEILKNNAAQFPNWQVNNFGLGIKDETALMNISANTESSSILDINETHIEIAPNAVFVGKEQIILKQLDSIFSEIYKLHKNIFLKIDTQGFEYNVLEGALKSLPYIKGIELEMSFVPLYKDEKTFAEMHDYITNKGFQLALIEPQIHQADTGALIQADCVFVQKNNKTS